MEMNSISYNNRTDRNLSDSVIELIHQSTTWIKACNLLFDDVKIRQALLDAASRGVAIFVLTNLQGVMGGQYKDRVSGKLKSAQQSSQDLQHTESLKKLYDGGAHISGLDGLHAKFLLTNNGSGIITSLNFTPNSVDKISELGVMVKDKEYKELETIFDYLFTHPDKFHFISKNKYFSYECPSKNIDSNELLGLSKVKMTLGPTGRGNGDALSQCQCYDLRDEIFSIINSAKRGENLYIATYSIDPDAVGPGGETLAKALIDAKERGVRINIVIRKDKVKPIKGIYFNLHDDIHSKAVISSQRGIIFTGNLTKESFEKGFDLGITLTPEQICDTKKFIATLINQTKQSNKQ